MNRQHWPLFPVWRVGPDGACLCPRGGSCDRPGKHPRSKHGFKDAAPGWAPTPDVNVGLATGERSGLWVLDLDAKTPADGMSGLEAWEYLQARHGDVVVPMVSRTGGGGLHLFFRWPLDRVVRNRGQLKIDGQPTTIDVRGEGGYVLLPPSNHVSGRVYRWQEEGEPEDAPGWLLDLVAPSEEPRQTLPSRPERAVEGREARYAERVLASAVAAVAAAGKGQRHATLLRQAYTVGGYVHLLQGGAAHAEEELVVAGIASGKPEMEVRAAVRAALAKGAEKPIQVADRPAPGGGTGQGRQWEAPELPDEEDHPVEELPMPDGADDPPPWELDPEVPRDFLIEATGEQEERREQATKPPPRSIQINGRQLSTVVAEARDALRGLRGRHAVYQQDGRLVRLKLSPHGPASIEPLDRSALIGQLLRAADWVELRQAKAKEKHSGSGQIFEPARSIPDAVVSALLGAGELGLPELHRVATGAYYAADGRLVTSRGYDPASRTYLVEDCPWEQCGGVYAAQQIATRWLADFPFERRSDFAHALAFMLSVVCRDLIQGPVPMTVFEAPTQGTGKSLLMGVLAAVASGRQVAPSPLAAQEEERRKALVSLMYEGLPVVCLDNVKGKIADPALEGILTAYPLYSDRLMGGQTRITVQARTVWALSINNAQMSPDLARRTVAVRLNAQTENPEERTEFQIADITAWTRQNLAALRGYLLSMVEEWKLAGSPQGSRTLGSFESWSRIVGGILEACGVEGFLADRAAHRASGDTERVQLRSLLVAWHSSGLHTEVKAGQLAELAWENELLLDVLGDTPMGRARRMQSKLDSLRGQVFEIMTTEGQPMRVRIRKVQQRVGHSLYRLDDVDNTAGQSLPFQGVL